MGSETVLAKWLIIDHMVANNLKWHTIEIAEPMLKVFRNAYSSYKIHLEEEKRNVFLSEREKQALHISDDIKKLKLTNKSERESY